MTQRDSDRRAEDIRLAAEVAGLTKTLADHRHPDLEANIEELATALLGPPKSKLAGNGRKEEEGLVWKINEGGIKLYLPTWTKIVALLVVLAQFALGIKDLFT